jgi:carbon monoxide dehydrogenase subunit G
LRFFDQGHSTIVWPVIDYVALYNKRSYLLLCTNGSFFMAIIETSVQINRPVETVYAFLADLQNLKAQNPSLTSVTLNGPVAVGTHYITKVQAAGREFSIENEIVAIEPNKKFAVKTLAVPPASPVTTAYMLEPSGSGTKLTTSMDTVVMAPMPGMEDMIKGQLKSTLDMTNATLKKLIES